MAHLLYGETPSFGNSHHGQSQQHVPFPTTSSSLRILLLHGNLEICIREVKNLPNMDTFHKAMGDMFSFLPTKLSGKIEGKMSQKLTSDPYVTVSIAGAVIARTFIIRNNENPVWMQHFNVPVAHLASEIHFVVKDNDVVGSQLIGAVGIPVENLCNGSKLEGFFPILGTNGKPFKTAVLSLSIQYTPVDMVTLYRNSVGGVPATYFPLRKGGKVTLYQDAHKNGSVTGCPRQPWHDLHSKIEGPAAYDILTNFEERWLRALKMTTLLKIKVSNDDSLLKIDDEVPYLDEHNQDETWHVQIFRSIDSNSVKGFPKEPKEAIQRVK